MFTGLNQNKNNVTTLWTPTQHVGCLCWKATFKRLRMIGLCFCRKFRLVDGRQGFFLLLFWFFLFFFCLKLLLAMVFMVAHCCCWRCVRSVVYAFLMDWVEWFYEIPNDFSWTSALFVDRTAEVLEWMKNVLKLRIFVTWFIFERFDRKLTRFYCHILYVKFLMLKIKGKILFQKKKKKF